MTPREKLIDAFEFWKKYQIENPDIPKPEDVDNYGESCVDFLERYTGIDFNDLNPV